MEIYDSIIVGAGPAGMSAAIYLKRSNLSFLLLDKGAPGGKLNEIGLVDTIAEATELDFEEYIVKVSVKKV